MNTFNIDDIFNDLISRLQKGDRPRLQFEQVHIETLENEFHKSIEQKDTEKIEKLLCILDHLQPMNDRWKKVLINIIQLENTRLSVLALGTSHRHVLHHHQRKGERVGFDFMKVLENLLETNDPEILEWTLRTIEALGGQSIFFKQKVLAAKPNLFQRFQNKWKNANNLIKFMEENWKI